MAKLKLKDLEQLESLAKKATWGKYAVKAPKVKDNEIEYKLHGGWRTDSYLEVTHPFDSNTEAFYQERNTPQEVRKKYEKKEKIIDSFSYRGPAQTHSNAEYFAALNPETLLKLINLAKQGLEKK